MAVLPEAEYLGLNLTLNLDTKLYYFASRDGSLELMEAYAVGGIPVVGGVGKCWFNTNT